MLIHLRSTIKKNQKPVTQRLTSHISDWLVRTFYVSVPGAVVTHPKRRPFLGLGAQRRLKQIVHTLVVDLKEGHPHRELAAAPFCQVTGQH